MNGWLAHGCWSERKDREEWKARRDIGGNARDAAEKGKGAQIVGIAGNEAGFAQLFI